MSRASAPSLFRDGFAALSHEPALLAAELAWRWCFGLSALALIAVSSALYLDSLDVSKADQFLLSTFQPHLLGEALRHIFRGSLSRLLLEQAVLVVGLTLLWSFASAAGRAAALRRLVAMFNTDDEPQSSQWHFRSIFLLHLMRAIWTQVALIVGVTLLVWGGLMASNDRPLAAAISIAFGVGFAALIGFYLNWYLGLAPLFCIRNDLDARDAVDRSMAFSTEHGGRLFLMGIGFFLLRLIWAMAMWLVFLAPLELVGIVDGRGIAFLMTFVALIYFAGADWLHLVRWGAYVSLTYQEPPPPALPPATFPDVEPPLDLPSLPGLA